MHDPAELVVFAIRSRNSKCSECGEAIPPGAFLRKEGETALCLDCADLGDLVFLPSGDAAVTRRASKHSRLRAVVVQWSRTRKRYERQGILVEPAALERAEEESLADAEVRRRRQMRASVAREVVDRRYVESFARAIRGRYPSAPPGVEMEIAEHACRKYSGRVGRSAAAKNLDPATIDLAVQAYVRHHETNYDELLMKGYERSEARRIVREMIDRTLDLWRS